MTLDDVTTAVFMMGDFDPLETREDFARWVYGCTAPALWTLLFALYDHKPLEEPE